MRVLFNSTQWRAQGLIAESLDCLVIHLRNQYSIWGYRYRPEAQEISVKDEFMCLDPALLKCQGPSAPSVSCQDSMGSRIVQTQPLWIPGEVESELNRRANGMGDQLSARVATTTWFLSFTLGLQNPREDLHKTPVSCQEHKRTWS